MGKLTQEEVLKRFTDYVDGKATLLSKYTNKNCHLKLRCNDCGFEWELCAHQILYGKKHGNVFSGCPKCKWTTLKCAYCGKEFQKLKSKLVAISGKYFCSHTCSNRYKNISIFNPFNSLAYRRNAFLVQPHKCALCGWDKDERVLQVHHIDENHNNNDISNLIILCPNCHQYLTLHLYSLEELRQLKQDEMYRSG